MVEEERSDTRLLVTVDDGPVHGSRTTVLGQQCRVEVEGTHGRHGPHYLGKHAEGHHDLQVCLQGTQLCQELLILEFLRL